MPHDLELDDILSRFIYFRKYINFEHGVVKTSLFTEKHPNGFSVFRTTGLSEKEIIFIANNHVNSDKTLYGRCDLRTEYYIKAELKIKKSEPPPRHYNVFGMPVGSDLEKARKLAMRQEMVANSKLIQCSI